MRIQIAPVTAGAPHGVFQLFATGLGSAPRDDALLRAGFAYATLAGVQEFIARGTEYSEWNAMAKQFVIGIHNAITEPSAIEELRNMANSDVRVFVPNGRIVEGVFDAKPVFHPKVLAVSSSTRQDIRYLQVGSANLTAAAIGTNPRNYEFSLALLAEGNTKIDVDGKFGAWWTPLWRQSKPASRELVRRYAALRQKVLQANPILRLAADVPASIRDAQHFFIEVGAGSGPPGLRHQVEFSAALARFFGPVRRARRDITLRDASHVWASRPLSHKRTTFEVDIWRLGMPTQTMGGPPIAERAIMFTRNNLPNDFDVAIVDAGSAVFQDWVRSANLHGHLGATRGLRSRQYGFF